MTVQFSELGVLRGILLAPQLSHTDKVDFFNKVNLIDSETEVTQSKRQEGRWVVSLMYPETEREILDSVSSEVSLYLLSLRTIEGISPSPPLELTSLKKLLISSLFDLKFSESDLYRLVPHFLNSHQYPPFDFFPSTDSF